MRDFKTRFRLALACGNIEIAMETVDKLGEDETMQQGEGMEKRGVRILLG